jgi:hypothetical protein
LYDYSRKHTGFLGAKLFKVVAIAELKDENSPSFSPLNSFGTFSVKSRKEFEIIEESKLQSK